MTSDRSARDSDSASELFLAELKRAITAEGWQAGPPLIAKNWDRFVSSAPAVLLAAIKELPGEALVETPRLLAAANYLKHLVAGTDPKFFRRGVQVTGGDWAGPDGLHERLVQLTERTSEKRTEGRFDEAVDAALSARRTVDGAPADIVAQVRMTLPHLIVQWARSLDAADDMLAFREYEAAYDLAILTGQHNVARRAAGSISWMYAERGSSTTAKVWLTRARATDLTDDRYDIVQSLTSAMVNGFALTGPPYVEPDRTDATLPVGEYWAASLWMRGANLTSVADAVILREQLERDVAANPESLSGGGANYRYVTFARLFIAAALQSHVPEYDPMALDASNRAVLEAAIAYRRSEFQSVLKIVAGMSGHNADPRQRASILLLSAASHLKLGSTRLATASFAEASMLIEHKSLYSLFAVIRADEVSELCSLAGVSLSPELLEAIEQRRVAPNPLVIRLTAREKEMLGLVMGFRTNDEIAAMLHVSKNTVKATKRNLYIKLGAHSRDDVIELGRRFGFTANRHDPRTDTIEVPRFAVHQRKWNMTDGQNDLQAIARSLYELPPAKFTSARNKAAAEASKNPARRIHAPALKRLPKASATAWAVTALARDDADLLDGLTELGRRMRDAQSALDPGEMRTLGAERQRLVAEAASRARALAVQAGVTLSGSALIEVSQTLQAAMTDVDAAAAVRSGLLVRGLAVSGWEPVALAGAVALSLDGLPAQPTGARSGRARASGADPAVALEQRKLAEAAAWSAMDDVAAAQETVRSLDSTLGELASRRTELESERADIEEQLRGVEADLAEVYRDTQLSIREKKAAERDHVRAIRRAKQAQEKLDQQG